MLLTQDACIVRHEGAEAKVLYWPGSMSSKQERHNDNPSESHHVRPLGRTATSLSQLYAPENLQKKGMDAKQTSLSRRHLVFEGTATGSIQSLTFSTPMAKVFIILSLLRPNLFNLCRFLFLQG